MDKQWLGRKVLLSFDNTNLQQIAIAETKSWMSTTATQKNLFDKKWVCSKFPSSPHLERDVLWEYNMACRMKIVGMCWFIFFFFLDYAKKNPKIQFQFQSQLVRN